MKFSMAVAGLKNMWLNAKLFVSLQFEKEITSIDNETDNRFYYR
jgi:hypothetical protein